MDDANELVSYFNGQILPQGQVMADLSSGGYKAAAGFYDAERTFGGEVFKLRNHLQRLYNSLEVAQIDPGMEQATREVLEANRSLLKPNDDFILSQMVTSAPRSETNGSPKVNVVISCQLVDFHAFAEGYLKGVRIITPDTYAVPRRSPATGQNVSQEVFSLLADHKGTITECRRANFMFVKDGRIKLPDRSKVLPGVSMETVLELSDSLSLPVDEGDYNTGDVYEADEAFVSGTRFCLLPAATLNGLDLGSRIPGGVTGRLMEAWSEMVGVDCRWSTIMSVVNRSGKMSVHERIDIDPERTGKAPSAQRYPGRSDISG